jgi:hypothetical protein
MEREGLNGMSEVRIIRNPPHQASCGLTLPTPSPSLSPTKTPGGEMPPLATNIRERERIANHMLSLRLNQIKSIPLGWCVSSSLRRGSR